MSIPLLLRNGAAHFGIIGLFACRMSPPTRDDLNFHVFARKVGTKRMFVLCVPFGQMVVLRLYVVLFHYEKLISSASSHAVNKADELSQQQ